MHVSKLDEMYEQFCKNVETVKEKFHIAEQLDNVHEEKAVKDIYRSQIVFLESALDYYMHCLGIYAMVQMYNNHWDKTRGYSDLKVPIDKVMDAVMHPENTGWIDAVIVSYHASKTYMSAKEIKVYNQKIAHSRELLESTMKRRSDLDENYFVHGRFTKEKYEELTQKQNDIIKTEQSNIRKFETAINSLQQQIQADITFDDMLDALGNSYEHLKNGTTPETMRKIIHRYITEINVEPVEGRRTVFWKKVIIHTPHDAEKQAEIKCLREQGLSDVAITITNVFYVDTYHKKAYWDKDMQNCVPMVYIQRLERKRGK